MSAKQTRSRHVADNYRQARQKCQYVKVGAVCEMNGDKRQSLSRPCCSSTETSMSVVIGYFYLMCSRTTCQWKGQSSLKGLEEMTSNISTISSSQYLTSARREGWDYSCYPFTVYCYSLQLCQRCFPKLPKWPPTDAEEENETLWFDQQPGFSLRVFNDHRLLA